MKSIYDEMRSYENGKIRLRGIRKEDGKQLLDVYSDPAARRLFNCDNFKTPCYFDTLEEMEAELAYYQLEYDRRGFVRWAIELTDSGEVVGTVELFHRVAEDALGGMAILRMDVRSDYEKAEFFVSLIGLIQTFAYDDFLCEVIASKGIAEAAERLKAFEQTGFVRALECGIGHDGQALEDYYVCERKAV